MAYRFEYRGGVRKPHVHQLEKFLIFFVVGGREIPFYQMQQDNLVVKLREKDEEYQTANNVMKIFVMQTGFGIARRYHSFYLRLMPDPHPIVVVTPFPTENGRVVSDFFFKAQCKFLTRTQALDLLSEENESMAFVKRQPPLPLDTLRSMVTVDRSSMKRGVRHVRLGRKKEK